MRPVRVDSAWFLIFRAATGIDRAREGVESDRVGARVRCDCGYASDLAREGVELPLWIPGGTAFSESS